MVILIKLLNSNSVWDKALTLTLSSAPGREDTVAELLLPPCRGCTGVAVVRKAGVGIPCGIFWIAAKELHLNCHNRDLSK